MKKTFLFFIVIMSLTILGANAKDFLQLKEAQITSSVYEQIARNNQQVRGPSFNFTSYPYNLPDATDLADPATGRFYEDVVWIKDFSRHINNPGGGQLYLYYSNAEHFNISQPDPLNPMLLKFEPIPQHWNGSELMVFTVSDQPLDRMTRAASTAIVRINVTSVPDPPIFDNLPPANKFYTDENVPITLNFRNYVRCIDSAVDDFDLFIMQTQDPIGPDLYNVMVSQQPSHYVGHLATFTPRPYYNSPAGVRFVITAVDRVSNGFSTIEMTLVIRPINDPPQIISHLPASLNLVLNQNDTRHFEVNAFDVDGDVLTHVWTLSGNIGGVPFSHIVSTSPSLDYTFDTPGIYTLNYEVSDTWFQDSITWTITVMPTGPIFNPVPLPSQPWFDHGIAVSLSVPPGHEGATIYYSMDGSIPSIGAPGTFVYDQPIDLPALPNVENIKTIRAFYYDPANPPASQIVSYTYRITGQVADPIFNPPGGNHYNQVTLNITCPNLAATIYYTTDGSDPIPGAPNTFEYTGTIIIPTDTYLVVKAIAVRDDWIDSNIVMQTYNVTGVVIINSLVLNPPPPPSGDFYDVDIGDHLRLTVASMSFTPPTASLYYLVDPTPFDDDTLPGPDNPNSFLYTPGTEILLNCPTIIKFRAFHPGWQPSGTITKFYDVRTRTKILPFTNGTIFDPAPHTSTAPIQVHINTLTDPPNAPIYYTTDGSDPTENPALRYYGGPINLSHLYRSYTIKVLAHDPAFCPSQIYTGVYHITGNVDTPQFDPVPSSYQTPISVTITSSTSGATIYYTLDGSSPDNTANLYTAPVALGNGNHLLRAIAYKADWLPSNIRTGTYRIGFLPPPIFNLAGGNYTSPIVVHLSNTVPDVVILYSLTGGAPYAAYDPILGIPIGENQNVTITTYASKLGWGDSDIVSQSYNVTGSVAMPTFNPGGGSYAGVQYVTISSATPGATIRWTLDGQDPSLTYGNDYTGPVTIAHSATLKARAFLTGWAPSAINSADYTIFGNIAAPVFIPAPGNYSSPVNVHISVNPPTASIYYTTDGSTPNAGSTLYTGAPITVGYNSTLTIKAIAIQAGWNDSSVATGIYNVTGRVATPSFTPPSGSYATPPLVTISTSTPGAEIRYTLDGSDPSETEGTVYTAPIQLTGSTQVKAIAYLAGWESSIIGFASYVVNPQVSAPVFSPAGGYYSLAPQNVSITSYTPGAEIRYTLDGTDPDQITGLIYTGASIPVEQHTLIRARAFKTDHLNSATSSAEYFFMTANPILSPAAGAYADAINVSMDSSTPGVSIRYTVDGGDPSPTSGIVYDGSPINLTHSATIRAIAYKAGWISSNVVIYSYVINGPVNAPQFSIAGGDYYNTLLVSISTLPATATIHYTTDGTDPSDTNGIVYNPSTPVQINVNTTLKARAYLTNWQPSAISTAVYNLFTRPVSFSPVQGTYSAAQDVSLSSITPGARIWYRTDGGDPVIGVSSEYSAPIHVAVDTVIKAIARVDGWYPSPITSSAYDISIPLPQVNALHINPPSGVYTSAVDVTISTSTPDAEIWYTINGPDPNPTNGILYISGGFSVDTNSTIRARAYKPGHQVSELATAQYIIVIPIQTVATPTFTPNPGVYDNSVVVTIETSTPGAQIYYTINGAEPDNNSTLYTVPIPINSTTNIKAIAYKAGMNNSLISNASYVINVVIPNVDSPVFSMASGLYYSPIDVAITTSTADAEIWYSFDGSDPFAGAPGSVLYSSAINIPNSSSRFIKARAFKAGYNPSPVVSASYNVTGTTADVVFSVPSGTYTSAQSLILTTSTPDATIRYTTDGTDPDASSSPYVTAIAINSSMSVKARAYKTNWLPGNIASETYVITGNLAFDQPHLSPAPGTYGNAINVSIAAPIPADAEVWYTLDGSTPSATNGILYSAPISVNQALTIKAVALKAGWTPVYISGSYDFKTAVVGFAPPSGSYPNAVLVTLSSPTLGAAIRYTLDGSDPSATNGMDYTAPINVDINRTIKAYATKAGWLDSEITSATYAIGSHIPMVDTPVFNPASGTYTQAQAVSISISTPGAVIYYTTDGSEPTEASPVYLSEITLGLDSITTIKAKAFKAGWMSSATATELYVITGKVQAPVFTPPAGDYTTAQSVVLMSATPGAFIRYTLDGTDPVAGSPLYVTPISAPINQITTIKARAYKNTWADSDISTAVYNVTGAVAFMPPAFSPAAGNYGTSQMISISAPIPASATVKYTLDGSVPSRTNGIVYTAPFELNTSSVVQAIAYLDGWQDSPVVSAAYQLSVAAPVFTPQSGTYPSLQVTLSSSTPSAQIRYTTDGTDPSATHGTLYAGGIDLPSNSTHYFKAIAFKDGWQNSLISYASYNVTGTVSDVVFSIPSGTYTTAQNLVLSTPTPGASIFFSTDGSDPSPASTLYTTSIVIPLNSSLTIRARAYRTDWLPSAISSAVYNITGTVGFDQISMSPAPGTYNNAISVSISQPSPATAQIWYTTNGSTPSPTNGTLYTVPIPVNQALTLRAVAIKDGWNPGYVSGNYNFQTAAVSFNPPGGSYEQTQSVSLSSLTTGATIRYTVDGTDPSPTNGAVYSAPITVNINQTIKAYAIKTGYLDSPQTSATYAIGTYVPVVATPVFNPLPGSYTNPINVTISTSTPGAVIRYTTNGSDPTASSPVYTSPIAIPNHTVMTIKAIGFKNEWDASQMAVGSYTVTGTVQGVTFNPVGGSYTTAQSVVLTTPTAGAAIYYTLNGSDPTESSSQYTQAISLALNSNTTIKARAYKNGWNASAIGSQTYNITGQVTIPGQVFTPAAGTYTTAQNVTISTTTLPAGAVIRYTENGSDPTATSPVYTGQQISVALNSSKTVKAKAFLAGWEDSPVYEAVYNVTGTISLPAAVFSPVAGTYQTAQNITINPPSVPTGVSLYYTTNGTDPTEASLLYQGPINLPLNSGSTTIKVRAYKQGWLPSTVASATYVITGTVAYMTPVFLPDPSVIYTSAVSVTINNVSPADAVIRYTTDGSEPSLTNGFTYPATPINLPLNSSTTIKTKAFKTDWTSSQTHTATYTITGQVAISSPVFLPAPGTYVNAQTVSISGVSTPTNAVVRFTTDGSDPTSTSPIYTSPIPLNQYTTTRIKARAFATNWQASPVYEGIYIINGAAIINGPVFTPPAGTYTTAQNLVISNSTLPNDASLYYTLDGTDPSPTNGTLYSSPIPLSLDQTLTVKVRAYGDNHWDPSIIHSATYHMTGQVIIPADVFSPDPAVAYTHATVASIHAPVPSSATVYYTTDGSTPDQNSTLYSAPIEIPLNTVLNIKARAYLSDWTPSPVYDATYRVTGQVMLASPLLDPTPGVYTSAQTLTIAAPAVPSSGAIIRYTITPDLANPADAPDPDETSSQYTGPIQIPLNSDWVIKIRGFSRDWIPSAVITAHYKVTGEVESPVFSLNGEVLPAAPQNILAGQEITISLASGTPGAKIYYTTAFGSDPPVPDQSSQLYDPAQPIVIPELSMDMRITARAFIQDWIPSPAVSYGFTVIPLPYDVRAFTYGGYIRLLWNSDIEAKSLEGFNVYRRKTTSGIWSKLNSTPVTSRIGADYFYDDYAIENGVSYVYRVTAIYNGVESPYSVTTTVEYQSSELDVSVASHAYPNPATTSTKIKLVLTRNDNVQVAVSIYDFAGKKIRTLTVPSTNSNLIEIPWDLKNSDNRKVGRGTYFARIVASDGIKKAERTIKISVK